MARLSIGSLAGKEDIMKKSNTLVIQSAEFANRIVVLARELRRQREYVFADQILRSGTSIGANIREAQFGESLADFSHKLHISLKEANETLYWLDILRDANLIAEDEHANLRASCIALLKMLLSAIRTTKKKIIANGNYCPLGIAV